MVKQTLFFGTDEVDWHDHYDGMPEYNNETQPPPKIVARFKFRDKEAFDTFMDVVKQRLYDGERVFDGCQRKNDYQAWFPLEEKASKYVCIDEN